MAKPKHKHITKPLEILLVGGNLWYLGEGMLGPLFAVFAQRVGGNVLDITNAWAVYLVVMGILYIVFGSIADKVDKKKLMVLGYALNAVFTFAYLLVHEPWQLFVVQGGLGVAAAMAAPTWSALYSEYEDQLHDGLTWGLAGGTANLVKALAMVTGGFIVSFGSFSALFITMGCIQVAATIYQARILKYPKGKKREMPLGV